ncbi:MAG: Gfo/Idh/MocA family protein [Candidatus Helarchaeota archaeon]
MELNIGIIGTGSISISHLISLKEIIESNLILDKFGVKVKVFGLCDIDEKKIKSLEKNKAHNAKLFTTNPDDLIKNEVINVIYISTPTKFHKDLYIRAAEEGKHIFIEKPLAFNSNDIKEMISIQKKQDIFSQVGLVLRHCPVFWKIKDLITSHKDDLGEMLGFIFRDDQEWPISTVAHPSSWRKDPSIAHAGCLYEHSIHDLDLLEFLIGDQFKLSTISANIRYVSSLAKIGLEDFALVNLEYKNGVSGALFSTWHDIARDERRVELFYENGCVILDGYQVLLFNEFKFFLKKRKKKFKMSKIVQDYFKKINYPQTYITFGAYFFENLAFLESIIKEREPYPDLKIGLRAHEIIETAYKSSKTGEIKLSIV